MVERFGWKFAPGDRVMETQNDYDREVFNGDLGAVLRIDDDEGALVVEFDGREVVYPYGELDTLVPAYATTIHKSQGSEYPAVVIPIATQHWTMLARNLLYTGVTRGKRLVVLIGQRKAIGMAVRGALQSAGTRSCASVIHPGRGTSTAVMLPAAAAPRRGLRAPLSTHSAALRRSSRTFDMTSGQRVHRSAPPAGMRMPACAAALIQALIASAGGAKEGLSCFKAWASAVVSRAKRDRSQPRCFSCRRASAGVITGRPPARARSIICSRIAACQSEGETVKQPMPERTCRPPAEIGGEATGRRRDQSACSRLGVSCAVLSSQRHGIYRGRRPGQIHARLPERVEWQQLGLCSQRRGAPSRIASSNPLRLTSRGAQERSISTAATFSLTNFAILVASQGCVTRNSTSRSRPPRRAITSGTMPLSRCSKTASSRRSAPPG